jgi:hypothetical protein
LNTIETIDWGEGRGTMYINCSLPEENVLLCDIEERERNWKLSRELSFSHLGIVDTRTFHTKGITTKKFFEVINKG